MDEVEADAVTERDLLFPELDAEEYEAVRGDKYDRLDCDLGGLGGAGGRRSGFGVRPDALEELLDRTKVRATFSRSANADDFCSVSNVRAGFFGVSSKNDVLPSSSLPRTRRSDEDRALALGMFEALACSISEPRSSRGDVVCARVVLLPATFSKKASKRASICRVDLDDEEDEDEDEVELESAFSAVELVGRFRARGGERNPSWTETCIGWLGLLSLFVSEDFRSSSVLGFEVSFFFVGNGGSGGDNKPSTL